MNDNLTTNASNEAESPAFLVGAVSGWFLVEITKPMSTTFKQGMNAWCKCTSDRKDFILKTLANDYAQEFGFAYRPHFKTCH